MTEENRTSLPVGGEAQNEGIEPRGESADVTMGESASGEVKEAANQGGEADTATSTAQQTNGTTQKAVQDDHQASENPINSSKETQNAGDTEMSDNHPTGEAARATATPSTPATNGTPAASKRASATTSSKKKSSAVPEHKSKKLNKKKSKPLTNLNAQPGEYYMARMKGHPPWPSVICDEDMLPHSLLSTRPVTAQLPDGSFKKPEYAEGGKRAYERTFPIMFLHTNEFAWIPNTELTFLNVESEAVKTPIEKGKSKTLLQAYKKAADNEDLDHFKGMLADHQKAIEADAQEREEIEKERAAKKAKKAARKSDVTVNDDDEMDIDEDLVAEKPKSKKRKKAEDSEDVDEKPAKTPKTATKLKLSVKTPTLEPSTKKKASKPKSAKAAKNTSDDEAVTPKVEEKAITPQQAKEMKEKKVLYYRHKLQRGFLSRDTTPKEDEMKAMSDFLAELEGYPDLEGSIIRATKIHKVLRGLIKLPSIPLDGEFRFKARSVELLGKWNDILSHDTSAGPSGDKDDDVKGEGSTAPTTNGAPKDTEKQAEKAEDGEAPAPEEETDAKLDNKIGTTVEGAKEADESDAKNAEPKKTAEEKTTDAPAIDSAPAAEYKPEQTSETTA